jgi:hypothetical protein
VNGLISSLFTSGLKIVQHAIDINIKNINITQNEYFFSYPRTKIMKNKI